MLVATLTACDGNDVAETTPESIETEAPAESNEPEIEEPEGEAINEGEPETENYADSAIVDTELLGLWINDYDEYEDMLILFRGDGSGMSMYVELDIVSDSRYWIFQWTIDNDTLIIEFDDGDIDHYEYTIYENVLTMADPDNFFDESFIRVEVGDIVGTWSDDMWYTYVFNADGTGRAYMLDDGEPYEFEEPLEFVWTSNNRGLLILTLVDMDVEIEYWLLGDILTMRLTDDFFSYILARVE